MHHQLPFFPSSLPDETLISRVSRYHIMSGNRTIQSTFRELFDRSPFALGKVVPFHLNVLASLMPDNKDSNLVTIIHDNTLFPLFRPFLGKTANTAANPNVSISGIDSDVSHVPRHVVGMSGDAQLCLSCIREDELEHGVSYWHRSHQIPGVTVCWKHQEYTIASCPNCRFPFQRPNKLLSAPWITCRCTETLPPNGVRSTCQHELAYALYAHELLLANIPPIPPDILMNTYREKIRLRGFARASQAALKEFQDSLINNLGESFIRKIDSAFSENRTQLWLRLSCFESALDMPITRHIMLGMYLFSSAINFNHSVHESLAINDIYLRKKNKKTEPDRNALRDAFRRKISTKLKKEPSTSMETLWKNNYRAIAWLFDNDKTWLNNIVTPKTNNRVAPTLISDSDASTDREYTLLVEEYSRKLFEQGGKPQRITIGKILSCLPKKISSTATHRKRYPILFAAIDLCKESSWCFSARRILWALSELDRLDERVTSDNIVLTSSVGHRAVEDIMRFCAWDAETMREVKANPKALLAKAGITRTWRGPSEVKLGELSGRGYKKNKTLKLP